MASEHHGGFDGLSPLFASALQQLIAASGGRVWIVSGYRSPEKQAALYAAAVKKYGAKAASHYVAPPGHSNHNKGIAADLGGDLKLAAQLATRFGLHRPMSWEPWHFEPNGSREKSSPQAYTYPPGFAPQDDVMYQTEQTMKPLTDTEDPHKLAFHLQKFGEFLSGPGLAGAPEQDVVA